MNHIFIVFGYGVPRDILKDENYDFYLKTVFNKIYGYCAKSHVANPLIILSGGSTDCFRPYQRTEAGEMAKFFSTFIKGRPFLKRITKKWVFIKEPESLSTLENLINSRKIILKRKITKATCFVFCEQTREQRVSIVAKKVFSRSFHLQVVPIDFDVSADRYLPPTYLARKEAGEINYSAWALRSPANLKKHHAFFEEKIRYFRKAGPKRQQQVAKEWWDKHFLN